MRHFNWSLACVLAADAVFLLLVGCLARQCAGS